MFPRIPVSVRNFAVFSILCFCTVPTAQAALVAQWTLDGDSAVTRPADFDSSSVWASLTNGQTKLASGTLVPETDAQAQALYVTDTTLGTQVLSLNRNAIVNLGKFPKMYLSQEEAEAAGDGVSDFTYSILISSDLANTEATDVLVGNRYPDANGGYQFQKITYGRYEYASPGHVAHAAGTLPKTADGKSYDGTWNVCTIVKEGEKLSYYVNGTHTGSLNAFAGLVSAPFSVGGDWSNNAERADANFSDLRVYDTAYSAADVRRLMGAQKAAVQERLLAGQSGISFMETFNSGLDSNVWNTTHRGLESDDTNAGGSYNYFASTNDFGQLVLNGTQPDQIAWRGINVTAKQGFTASEENEIIINVGRVSMETGTDPDGKSSTGARSGIILKDADGKYLVFAQNSENKNGNLYSWRVNNNSGGNQGNTYAVVDTDLAYHDVSIKTNGSTASFYLDGQFYTTLDLSNGFSTSKEFFPGLITSARYTFTDSGVQYKDTVDAAFDNFYVTERGTIDLPAITAPLADDFSGTALDSWKTEGNASLRSGIMQMRSGASAQYISNAYSGTGDFEIALTRDSMSSANGTESGLRLVGTDGSWLEIAQVGNGLTNCAEWELRWDGIDLAFEETAAADSGLEFLTSTDVLEHQLLLSAKVEEDGVSNVSLSIDDQEFNFTISEWEASFNPSLYALGAYAGFGDFYAQGAEVPEPSTWALLILGAVGIFQVRRIRKS